MARVVIVHGIANQYVGENQLRNAWLPALNDGLALCGHPSIESADCVCPFYGHLFRKKGSLGITAPSSVTTEADNDEQMLAEAIWDAAFLLEPKITPRKEELGAAILGVPRVVEQAVQVLSRVPYFDGLAPLQIHGEFRQVVSYFRDLELRSKIQQCVTKSISSDTRIVIGHSLGSVIAYEVLCTVTSPVALVTLGSPLGLRNVVFDNLLPAPTNNTGQWPTCATAWTNIAAKGDIVAAEKRLAPLFSGTITDHLIDSGWHAHNSTHYLCSVEAGKAVSAALTPT